MAKIRLVAFDIDGTLTIDRRSSILCLDAIRALRILDKNNIAVVLVSSNALPIVVGLKKYIGLSGPAIGETGALIFFNEKEIVSTTKYSSREAYEDVLVRFNEYVYGSWQNMFRIHDYALRIKKEYLVRAYEIYEQIKNYVEKHYDYLKVGYSGYAIHLTPKDTGKGKALRIVMERLGIRREETVGVGDSMMDLEFMEETGIKVAVGGSDKELVEKADLVLEKPSGQGIIDLVKMIIEDKI
jgi:phosphoglycolate phosphatase (TIGR01487 family)